MAPLAAVGIGRSVFTGVALALFRDTLEIPRGLDALDPSNLDGDKEVPLEECLLLVGTWIHYCPHKLKFLCVKSFDDFGDGGEIVSLAKSAGLAEEGFSVARWDFWTKRLVELGDCDNTNVAEEATSMDMMDVYRPL
jgi:hypothetical protein